MKDVIVGLFSYHVILWAMDGNIHCKNATSKNKLTSGA